MVKEQLKIGDYFVTISNYKEPLKPVEKENGSGFYGVFLVTTDGALAQCHICGEFRASVAVHTRVKHGVSAREYRERFQLQYTTALVSEKERIRHKELASELGHFNKINGHMEVMREQRQAWGKMRNQGQPPKTLESYNKTGTCPDQVLDKIRAVAEKLGHTPSLSEFIQETGGQRYKHLIYTVYGSWVNALKMLGMHPKGPIRGNSYTSDELLEALRMYYQQYKCRPTQTDFRRKLLPNPRTYKKHFGGLKQAYELAGI